MFGLAWTEIGLIGVVAMVLIGPKDLPIAIRTISNLIKRARKMAGEFQGHVDEMVREADVTGGLSEVRQQISELRGFNLRDTVTKAVDGDGTLRAAIQHNPLDGPMENWGANPTIHAGAAQGGSVQAGVDTLTATPGPAGDAEPTPSGHVELAPPAFIPPEATPLGLRGVAPEPVPAFIPPAAATTHPS